MLLPSPIHQSICLYSHVPVLINKDVPVHPVGDQGALLAGGAGGVQVKVVGVQARGGDLFHQAAPEILLALLI